MTRAMLLAACLALPGCFTSWVTQKLAGYPGGWREDVRDARVPLPGVKESLVVALPGPVLTPVGATEAVPPPPQAFTCEAHQTATDAVYTASSRYGRDWRRVTAIMFVAEAVMGGTLLLTGDNKPGAIGASIFFGADALGTAILFFAPRRDSYDRRETPVTTPLRSVCPDGVIVEIAGEAFPLDATGSLGELGMVAFADAQTSPAGPGGGIVISFRGQSIPMTGRNFAVFDLPPGTLAQVP